jgi:hypothetical protein
MTTFQIFVKNIAYGLFATKVVDVESGTTVGELKKLLLPLTRVPIDIMFLTHGTRVLEDNSKQLNFYNVGEHDTITVSASFKFPPRQMNDMCCKSAYHVSSPNLSPNSSLKSSSVKEE